MGITFGIVIGLLILLLSASIRVLREYERAVVFRLGRFVGVKGPGLFFLIPVLDRMVKVSLRVVPLLNEDGRSTSRGRNAESSIT